MKPTYIRRRHRPSTTDVVSLKKDNQKEQPFFGETTHEPFFRPASANVQAVTVQRKCAGCEKEEKLQRLPENKEEEKVQRRLESEQVTAPEKVPTNTVAEPVVEQEELPSVTATGAGTGVENKIAYANCQGVSVQGHTVANYDHGTYSASSTSVTKASNCDGCTGNNCLTITGNIVSVFQANPAVTLPAVPSGLSECEQNAVRTFIDTTLSQHEQQHVSAFNTYNATITTPFTYTGCRTGFDAYILGIHNGIEASRVASANALSDALDPFNPTIPCNCPEPAK